MSQKDARGKPKILTEKALLTEFLRLYKRFPCLWDQRNILYSNKEARQNAYEVLFEKYKILDENATLAEMKKKIEHMRCAYRREHKKVLNVKLREGATYVPHLWYYNLLTFINDHSDTNSQHGNSYQIQETHEIEDSDDDEPLSKKGKNDSSNNAICPTDSESCEVPVREEILFDQEDQDDQNGDDVQNEPDAFGRTVGHQLKELTRIQRIHAEKLISDVIYQARLGKLNADSTVYLNDFIM